MSSVRLPRFQRSPAIASLRLTDRDQDILRLVHRHRFLRSDHLTALLPGSAQQLLRRLQRLYHHGYLDRPTCQIDRYKSGSSPMVYGIGNKGAGWLKREQGVPYRQLDWGDKGQVGRLFLDHALLVSDVMVALALACRRRPEFELLTANEATPTVRDREPFQWSVNLPGQVKCGVIPDRVFGLQFRDESGRRTQAWYFLEADRGTMPITRTGLDRSSIQRKLLAYAATWSQNLHRTRFGWNRFRVLTVTSSEKRIASMQEAVRSMERGQGLFLFARAEDFADPVGLLERPLLTCRENGFTSLVE